MEETSTTTDSSKGHMDAHSTEGDGAKKGHDASNKSDGEMMAMDSSGDGTPGDNEFVAVYGCPSPAPFCDGGFEASDGSEPDGIAADGGPPEAGRDTGSETGVAPAYGLPADK
jgi:hypothetical protein